MLTPSSGDDVDFCVVAIFGCHLKDKGNKISHRFRQHRIWTARRGVVAGGGSPRGDDRLVCRVPAPQSPKYDARQELVKTINHGKMTVKVTRLLPFTAVVMLVLLDRHRRIRSTSLSVISFFVRS